MKRFRVAIPTYPIWYFALVRGGLALSVAGVAGLALAAALDRPVLLGVGLAVGLPVGLVLAVRRYMHLRKEPEGTTADL